MGIVQSSLAKAGTPCLVVEPMKLCPMGGRGVNQAKPSDLAVDDALWSELVRRIDPLARDLNRGMAVVAVVMFLSLVLVGFIAVGLTSFLDDLPAFYVFIPAFVSSGSIVGYILHVKNRGVDRQIEAVLGEVGQRFEAAGYRARYETQYTGLCKPKHARSERVISFARLAGASVETGNTAAAAARRARPMALGASVTPVGAVKEARPHMTDAGSSTGWKGEEGTGGKSLVDQLKG